MVQTKMRPPEVRADLRDKYLSGLQWHVGTFVIINTFFWLMDVTLGTEGVQWAHWIAGFWGLALAFHALAYFVAGRRMEG